MLRCERSLSNWRLAVQGALLLTDEDFRIFQMDPGEEAEGVLDECLSLRIDDPFAVNRVREHLPRPSPG